MADEFVDCASQLWDAWEPDAVVMDEENHTFIDPKKVKVVNFEGKFYKTRGPLNVPRSPQGRPVFVAPGGHRAAASSPAATPRSCWPAAKASRT